MLKEKGCVKTVFQNTKRKNLCKKYIETLRFSTEVLKQVWLHSLVYIQHSKNFLISILGM